MDQKTQQQLIWGIFFVIIVGGLIWSHDEYPLARLHMNGESLLNTSIVTLILVGMWKKRKRRG